MLNEKEIESRMAEYYKYDFAFILKDISERKCWLVAFQDSIKESDYKYVPYRLFM